MNLVEWCDEFVGMLNSFKRDLIDKKVYEDRIICTYKEKGEITYLISPELDKKALEEGKEGKINLVCLNKKANLYFVIENWDYLIKNHNLKIIFANPQINQKWIISPYTHDIISDRKSLKVGLKSIFESVPEV